METLVINTKALRMNEDDFFDFCVQNRDLRMERDANQNIYIMSPTGGITGKNNFYLSLQLGKWNEKHKYGYAFDSSTGFSLPNGATRSPDLAWIKKERWEKLPLRDRERFAHICPDFIIELKSKTDSLQQLQNKMKEWMDSGCRLAWLIDLENKTTYIYRPNKKIEIIHTDQGKKNKSLEGENVLQGFKLNVSELEC